MEGKEFDFWQDHSLHYLEMALRTDRREIIKDHNAYDAYDAYGKRTGECGDTVEILTHRYFGDRL